MNEIDGQILETIDRIRETNHACTAGAVADSLRMSKSWIVQRCEIMRAAGLVDWTPMSGSLHRVRTEATNRTERPDLPVDTTVIAGGSIPEPATPTTPAATSAISGTHDVTHDLDTVVWVTGNNDHRPSLSEPMKRNNRSKSSGT